MPDEEFETRYFDVQVKREGILIRKGCPINVTQLKGVVGAKAVADNIIRFEVEKDLFEHWMRIIDTEMLYRHLSVPGQRSKSALSRNGIVKGMSILPLAVTPGNEDDD